MLVGSACVRISKTSGYLIDAWITRGPPQPQMLSWRSNTKQITAFGVIFLQPSVTLQLSFHVMQTHLSAIYLQWTSNSETVLNFETSNIARCRLVLLVFPRCRGVNRLYCWLYPHRSTTDGTTKDHVFNLLLPPKWKAKHKILPRLDSLLEWTTNGDCNTRATSPPTTG